MRGGARTVGRAGPLLWLTAPSRAGPARPLLPGGRTVATEVTSEMRLWLLPDRPGHRLRSAAMFVATAQDDLRLSRPRPRRARTVAGSAFLLGVRGVDRAERDEF
ncbi:hypothetical protein GCM10020216_108370 [Nonomuraea helvata]